MFDYATFKTTALELIGAFVLSTVAVGAAVGPATSVSASTTVQA